MHRALLFMAMSLAPLVAISAPETPSAIREAFAPAAQLCRTESTEEISLRLLSGWSRCFAKSLPPASQAVLVGKLPILIPAGSGSSTSVRVEYSSDTTTLISEGTGAIGIMMIADVRKTDACAAEVQIRGASKFINSIAQKSARFVEDPDAKCPADDR